MSDTGSRLTTKHRAYLNCHAITDEVLDRHGVRSIADRDELPRDIAELSYFTPAPGILFPVRMPNGKASSRYRPDIPERDEDDREAKYIGPAGVSTINMVRTGPIVPAVDPSTGKVSPFIQLDGFDKILFVEGNKQVLAADSYAPGEYAVIGVHGCRAWSGADFSFVSGRDVFVAFDSDVWNKSNPDVPDAAEKFSVELKEAGAASVRFVFVPGDQGTGLDDALALIDPEGRTEALRGWLEEAGPLAEENEGEPFDYEGPYEDRVKIKARDLYVNQRARGLVDDRIAKETGRAVDWESRAHNGADWLDVNEPEPKPLWGTPDTPLWLPGESLTIVGPPSVGKSTLAHAVIWGALGLTPDLLDFPVEPMDGGGILYLAMDRPRQIKRAMARFLRAYPDRQEEITTVLRERLTIWEGPLPGDPTMDKRLLISMAEKFGRTRIVVDSLKDVIPNASDEAKAGGYNMARQEALAEGFEWIELHHNRKAGAENKKPSTLDDVYGSRWITAGAGSVLSLFGQPGDIVLELTHLKPLGEPIMPTQVVITRQSGEMAVYEKTTPLDILRASGVQGLTVEDAARSMYGILGNRKLTPNEVENTRNKLNRMVRDDQAEKHPKTEGPVRYRVKDAENPWL
jgi:hypothetical protein